MINQSPATRRVCNKGILRDQSFRCFDAWVDNGRICERITPGGSIVTTCFVAGIVKGLIEHGDPYRHFGSLLGYKSHLHKAIAAGVVNADESLGITELGKKWYAAANLAGLEDCRAYFWGARSWEIASE